MIYSETTGWGLSIRTDWGLHFALQTLLYDGLRVPPFEFHPDGNREFRDLGLDPQLWGSWVRVMANAHVAAMLELRQVRDTTHLPAGLADADPLTAMARVSSNSGLAQALARFNHSQRSQVDIPAVPPRTLPPSEVAEFVADILGRTDDQMVVINLAIYPRPVAMRLNVHAFLVGTGVSALDWPTIRELVKAA